MATSQTQMRGASRWLLSTVHWYLTTGSRDLRPARHGFWSRRARAKMAMSGSMTFGRPPWLPGHTHPRHRTEVEDPEREERRKTPLGRIPLPRPGRNRRATPRHPPVNSPSYLLMNHSWRVLGLPWLHPGVGRAPRRADWSWSAGSAGFLLQLGQLHAHPLDLVGVAARL